MNDTLRIYHGAVDGNRPKRFMGQTIAFKTNHYLKWDVGIVGFRGIVKDDKITPFDDVVKFVILV